MTDHERAISRLLHQAWDAFKDLPRDTTTLEDQAAFQEAVFGAQVILNRVIARPKETPHHE